MIGGHTEPPQAIGMYITQRCNLGCKMCYVWKGKYPEELSTAGMKRVFHHLSGGTPRFSISGGEPLMREDITELLKYANGEGFRPELLTNATLITRGIAKAIVKYCKGIIVSIDGNKELHDSIRGRGSFDKAMRGIRLVREAGDTIVKINTTISKLNVAKLNEVVDIASDLRASLSFQHLIFSRPKQMEQHKQYLIDDWGIEGDAVPQIASDLNELDTDLLTQEIIKTINKAKRLGVSFHMNPALKDSEEVRQWYSTLEPVGNMGCAHPWCVLFIRQDGEVLPCEFIQYPLGNLAEHKWEEIWNGDKAVHFRETWAERGLFPNCVRCCKLVDFNLTQGG